MQGNPHSVRFGVSFRRRALVFSGRKTGREGFPHKKCASRKQTSAAASEFIHSRGYPRFSSLLIGALEHAFAHWKNSHNRQLRKHLFFHTPQTEHTACGAPKLQRNMCSHYSEHPQESHTHTCGRDPIGFQGKHIALSPRLGHQSKSR
jgi:hypothetical protein